MADRKWQNAESYVYDTGSGQVERDRLLVKHDRHVWGVKSDLTVDSFIGDKPNVFCRFPRIAGK